VSRRASPAPPLFVRGRDREFGLFVTKNGFQVSETRLSGNLPVARQPLLPPELLPHCGNYL